MARKFKLDARVIMSKTGEARYVSGEWNPHKIAGRVVRYNTDDVGDHPYTIAWENGRSNVYDARDLDHLDKILETSQLEDFL